MENKDWIEYKVQIRERLRLFALKILALSEKFVNNERSKIVNNQLTRSGTSVYANYRAALRARSKKEFYSKLSIAVEEADETEMWLDLLLNSNIINSNYAKDLYDESLEILKILASMRKKITT